MRKVIFIIGLIFAILALGYVVNLKYTKSFSPEDVASYNGNGLNINVYYCQPSKKGRQIFGSDEEALVPFGQLWRTGANEATEIELNQEILINGLSLPAGRYSLFTVPNEKTWTVVFNSELDQWGAFTYDEMKDVLRVETDVTTNGPLVEMFTIDFTEDSENRLSLNLSWDSTRASLPIEF